MKRKLSGNSDPSAHIWCLSAFLPQETRDTRGEVSLTSFNVVFNNYKNLTVWKNQPFNIFSAWKNTKDVTQLFSGIKNSGTYEYS